MANYYNMMTFIYLNDIIYTCLQMRENIWMIKNKYANRNGGYDE